ncbi:MAG: hypothetical protein QXV01_10790 [Candidatus Bathyarchaeia archaeon]
MSRFKKVLNSWLSYNGIDVKLKVNNKGDSDTPRIAMSVLCARARNCVSLPKKKMCWLKGPEFMEKPSYTTL